MNSPELVEKVAPTARFLAIVIAALVDDPSRTVIRPDTSSLPIVFRVEVPRAELGKLIGRSGRMARALRTVLTARGRKDRVAYALEIEALEDTPC